MKKLAALLAALTLSAPAAAPAAVLNDEVTSVKLKEADGTSGQNTNSGAGVKTGHLQNAAVTGVKIADGAVTDAKITGPISAAKLGAHAHAQADVSGLAAALAAKADLAKVYQRFANVVVVSQDGRGDFTDPVAAMAAITDASEVKPYLLKILPGKYAITTDLFAKPYVDIEGSGRDVTVITTATGVGVQALVFLSRNMELRDLSLVSDFAWCGVAGGDGSVRNVSISLSGAGIGNNVLQGLQVYAQAGFVTRIQDVDVKVRAAAGTYGYGIWIPTGNVVVKDSSFDIAGANLPQWGFGGDAGSYLDVSNSRVIVVGEANATGVDGLIWTRLRNAFVSVQGATAVGVSGVVADVFGSEIAATGPTAYATRTGSNGAQFSLANTKVQGTVLPPSYPGGIYRCIGVYDGNLAPVTCP